MDKFFIGVDGYDDKAGVHEQRPDTPANQANELIVVTESEKFSPVKPFYCTNELT